MSVESQIESAIASLLETHVVGFGNVQQGPITQPEVEGNVRKAAVRVLGARGARLAYGQTSWTDSVAISVYWRDSIDRATRLTEFQAFRDALIADQYLGGAVAGLQDAYLTLEAWGEAKDGAFVTMSAEIETERIE